jgi:hypothetical protein
MIDLIRVGVSSREMARSKNGEVSLVHAGALSTANSAVQRGHDRVDWQALVLDGKSGLGAQIRAGGRKSRSPVEVQKYLDAVWDNAVAWIATRPPAAERSPDIATRVGNARRVLDVLADPDAEIGVNERRVLAAVADEGIRLGTATPAIPRVTMLRVTGVGLTAFRTALRNLERAGLLAVVDHGEWYGADYAKIGKADRRADRYRLAAAAALRARAYPEDELLVPPAAELMVPPSAEDRCPPAELMVPPSRDRKAIPWVRGDDPAALVAALATHDRAALLAAAALVPDQSRRGGSARSASVESHLEALTMVRAAHRQDSGLASATYFGSEDQGALVQALSSLAMHLVRALHGSDVEGFCDHLALCQITEAASEVEW